MIYDVSLFMMLLYGVFLLVRFISASDFMPRSWNKRLCSDIEEENHIF